MLIKFPKLHILCPTISTYLYRKIFALFIKIKFLHFPDRFCWLDVNCPNSPLLATSPWRKDVSEMFIKSLLEDKSYFLIDLSCTFRDLFLRKTYSSKENLCFYRKHTFWKKKKHFMILHPNWKKNPKDVCWTADKLPTDIKKSGRRSWPLILNLFHWKSSILNDG